MADVKISELPAGTAAAGAIVPATNAAGTETQKVTIGGIVDLARVNAVASPAEITANADNYDPGTGDIFRITADGAHNITGVVARDDGAAILLINIGATNAITIKHADAASTDVNRVMVPWEGDYVLAAKGGAALLVYDGTTDRWRVI
jgi:hypothetical protein